MSVEREYKRHYVSQEDIANGLKPCIDVYERMPGETMFRHVRTTTYDSNEQVAMVVFPEGGEE